MSHSLSIMIGNQNTLTAMSDLISTCSFQLVFLQIKFHVMEAIMGLYAVTVVPEGRNLVPGTLRLSSFPGWFEPHAS